MTEGKLSLCLDDLQVESFDTAPTSESDEGTVYGLTQVSEFTFCNSCQVSACTCATVCSCATCPATCRVSCHGTCGGPGCNFD